MQEEVRVSTLVRDGGRGWTCGQCPLDRGGAVVAPGDLPAQAKFVRQMIESVLQRCGFDRDALGKLNVYFSAHDPSEGTAALSVFRDAFPGKPVIVPIAVPHFYYAGMQIEVDAFADSGARVREPQSPVSCELQIVEAGDTRWVSVRADVTGEQPLSGALSTIKSTLEAEGLFAGNLISDQWFLPMDRPASDLACLENEELVSNPDATVLIDPLHSNALACDLTFSVRPAKARTETADDGRLKVSLRSDGNLLTVTATHAEPKADLAAQTGAVMSGIEDALGAEGLSFANVTKVTAHYVGGATPEELYENMKIRHSHYQTPGPASTGLPVSALLNPDCQIAIAVVATI